ncbi:MAG: CDP-alcohol phosphatidyltransferase family protein [Nannocystaceae bacterium]|nr:CDP-alcohol phosphatidyltransferase family protein [Nannocystaceae bacterium]
MLLKSKLRFAAPNLVTGLGLVFGLMSLVATSEHRFVDAGWLIIWCVLIDRLDGLTARSLNASSEFGVQMDSLADAINFGVCPGYLVYVTLSSVPALGFSDGAGHVLLLAAFAAWVLATVYRLAKFNVVSEEAPGVFFGVATTLAAGVLAIWYLVLLKYGAPGSPLSFPDAFRGPQLLGDLQVPLAVWSYLPAAMIVMALLMASNAPMPKLGRVESKAGTAIVLVSVLAGVVCGVIRYLPDFMAWFPTSWLVCFLIWGQLNPKWRSLRAPDFLPD